MYMIYIAHENLICPKAEPQLKLKSDKGRRSRKARRTDGQLGHDIKISTKEFQLLCIK